MFSKQTKKKFKAPDLKRAATYWHEGGKDKVKLEVGPRRGLTPLVITCIRLYLQMGNINIVKVPQSCRLSGHDLKSWIMVGLVRVGSCWDDMNFSLVHNDCQGSKDFHYIVY